MGERLSVDLLHGFEVRSGDQPVDMPLGSQRVIAFLALRRRPCQRVFVAGNLWATASEQRANASLRSALWRAQRAGCAFVATHGARIMLADDIVVDVREAWSLAERTISSSPDDCDVDDALILRHAGDLLPDWYDDWVIIERERYRQDRLHALEALCRKLADRQRYGEAIATGAAAVAADPLRESAHRAVISAHLAEGNRCEALRQYRVFEKLARTQLNAEPTDRMRQLVSGPGPGP